MFTNHERCQGYPSCVFSLTDSGVAFESLPDLSAKRAYTWKYHSFSGWWGRGALLTSGFLEFTRSDPSGAFRLRHHGEFPDCRRYWSLWTSWSGRQMPSSDVAASEALDLLFSRHLDLDALPHSLFHAWMHLVSLLVGIFRLPRSSTAMPTLQEIISQFLIPVHWRSWCFGMDPLLCAGST